MVCSSRCVLSLTLTHIIIGYLYDGFIEEPDKTPQEAHFERFKTFVKQYGDRIEKEEQSMNDGDDASLGKLWDAFDDCIRFQFEAYEVQRFDELIQTDNKLLQKVMLVLATLCDEMDQLKQMVIYIHNTHIDMLTPTHI
jgi:hypothetical protein